MARDPYIHFVSRTARLDDDRLCVLGDLMARGSRIEVEIDATVAVVDDGYELEAETFVMHSGLGVTWNPGQISRPWSRLTVAGRLVRVPVSREVSPEAARSPAPSRRVARACCDTLAVKESRP